MSLNAKTLDSLAREIHADNVRAGWWTNLATGDSILATRNRGELMMLIVSELSEAYQGRLVRNIKDDKLPEFAMFDVELADTAIRLFDLIGAETTLDPMGRTLFTEVDPMDHFARATDKMYSDDPIARLMYIVNCVAVAMEHHRKGRTVEYRIQINFTLAAVFALARLHDITLFYIIERKREFNRNRADHKVENRKAAGGKQY